MDGTGRRLRRAAALAASVAATAAIGGIGAASAGAATLTVTTTADSAGGNDDAGACASGGGCTLRQALAAARGSDATIALPAGNFALTAGELAIAQVAGTVTVAGAGAGSTTIEQEMPSSRVLDIAAGGAVVLSGLTITGGDLRGTDGAQGVSATMTFPPPPAPPIPTWTPATSGQPGGSVRGGGIRNAGELTLADAVVRDNAAAGGAGGGGGAGGPDVAFGMPGAGAAGGSAHGGGIANDGTLRLQRSRVIDNAARGGASGAGGFSPMGFPSASGAGGAARGAGIANTGALTLDAATVAANVATGGVAAGGITPGSFPGTPGEAAGGGVAHDGGTLAIGGSTLSANAANGAAAAPSAMPPTAAGLARGGGLAATAPFALARSTVADNSATGGSGALVVTPGSGSGGGLWASAEGTLDAVTLAGNAARASLLPAVVGGVGGNVAADAGELSIRSSVITDGEGAEGAEDCAAPLRSLGGNVSGAAASECGLDAAGDQAGVALDLPALADNGGPTETIALPEGNPAIGAGDCAAAATDQRGAVRDGGSCDAGAFERTVPAAELLSPLDMLTNAATLRAALTSTFGATYRFSYGVADAGEHDLGVQPAPLTGVTPVIVEAQLSGLAEGLTYRYRFTLTDRDGTARTAEGSFRTAIKGPPPPIPVDRGEPRRQLPPIPTTPTLTKLSATPSSFQVRKARRHGRKRRVSGGTTVRLTLNTAATVSARVERLPARRGGKTRAVGTLALGAFKAGANTATVTGRVGRRTLAPGRYRLTLTAKSGALTSRAVTLVLVVRRG